MKTSSMANGRRYPRLRRAAAPLVILAAGSLAGVPFACSQAVGPSSSASRRSTTDPSASAGPTEADGATGDPSDARSSASDAASDNEAGAPRFRTYARVLHIGDSTVGGYGGLARALKVRFQAGGSAYFSDTTVSLGIRTFARSKRFADLLKTRDPDLVLLTLGTNDVSLPSPDQLAGDVRAIVAKVGARDCYWIGPPTWKADTGIVAVIRANAGTCRFFDSSLLPLARAGDGIHPTNAGGEEWARRFWEFFRGAETTSVDGGAASDASARGGGS